MYHFTTLKLVYLPHYPMNDVLILNSGPTLSKIVAREQWRPNGAPPWGMWILGWAYFEVGFRSNLEDPCGLGTRSMAMEDHPYRSLPG